MRNSRGVGAEVGRWSLSWQSVQGGRFQSPQRFRARHGLATARPHGWQTAGSCLWVAPPRRRPVGHRHDNGVTAGENSVLLCWLLNLGLVRRWRKLLGCTAAKAFAMSLLDLAPSGSDNAIPSVHEVICEARHS